LVCAALAALGCGPMVMFPGGRLSGDVKRAPSDWAFSESIDVVQIETRPSDPYSVNIWGAAKDGTFYVMAANRERRWVKNLMAFYVMAANRERRWVKNLMADPNVRLKVCDDVYEMRANEVTDEATIESVVEVLVAKYDFRPNAEQRAEGALFALTPRERSGRGPAGAP
jgi:hypothetical protein